MSDGLFSWSRWLETRGDRFPRHLLESPQPAASPSDPAAVSWKRYFETRYAETQRDEWYTKRPDAVERDVLTGHDAELAVFGVRLPGEPLERDPMPLVDLFRRECEKASIEYTAGRLSEAEYVEQLRRHGG